ncbi:MULTISPECIES: hypothetical protein [unclassified Roseivivax]|uniref:hypothetical protein n=1 Tax=Roseivivax sp. GX 12232 TaxID=2900547 RepID=UPI001E309192|nr:hypothetical protein [Roseivivax sp. GX 12232]MCE0504832.1 hypothetical protein [Roseivivax sp. GX 12232]
MAFFETLNDRLRKRAAFRRTRHELEGLPLETRVDLNINGRERDVARSAVYG